MKLTYYKNGRTHKFKTLGFIKAANRIIAKIKCPRAKFFLKSGEDFIAFECKSDLDYFEYLIKS